MLSRDPAADAHGHPYSGLVNSQNPTGETIEDLARQRAGPGPRRLRLRGPGGAARRHLLGVRRVRPVHHPLRLDRRADRRLSPLDGSLPHELAQPGPQPRHGGADDHARRHDAGRHDAVGAAAARPQRLQRQEHRAAADRDLRAAHPALHEYLYLLDDPKTNGTAVREIDRALQHDRSWSTSATATSPPPAATRSCGRSTSRGDRRRPARHVPGAIYDAGERRPARRRQDDRAARPGARHRRRAARSLQAAITPVTSSAVPRHRRAAAARSTRRGASSPTTRSRAWRRSTAACRS